MKAVGLFSIGGSALAAALILAACGSSSSSSPAGSAAGESCSRTSDCAANLVCIANTCQAKTVVVVPDAGSGDDASMAADGAPAPTPAKLGAGCTTSEQCGDPSLTCVPTTTNNGFSGQGVCDLASFGITPTGKTCGECAQASDCCEIPSTLPATIFGVTDAGTSVQVKTCGDLLDLVIGGNTAVCPVSGSTFVIEACNLYAQFCNGCATSNNWACNSGQCAYTGSCIVGATSIATYGSCPTSTRSNRALNLRCAGGGDAGSTGTCAAGTCAVDADCVGKAADNGFLCEGTDCVCHVGACFFQCATDLDCPGGYACDGTSKLCTLTGCTPGAAADQVCKTQNQNVKAICKTVNGTGACVNPCTGDHDCSQFSGAIVGTSFNQTVCGPNGYCVSVAGNCTNDTDCKTTSTTTNGFCTTTPPAAAIRSAISSH